MTPAPKNPGLLTHDEVWAKLSANWTREQWATYYSLRAAGQQHTQRLRIAEVVKAARKAKRWTQHRLAAETGIQQSEISRIEKAKANPTMETQAKLFAVLGIRVNYEFDTEPQVVIAA